MNFIDYFREVIFLSHRIGIIVTTFGWLTSDKIFWIHPPVIISWYLNNNQCLITQLEYKLFHCTFLGNGPKYHVPKRWRYLLYLNTATGLLYYGLLKLSILG